MKKIVIFRHFSTNFSTGRLTTWLTRYRQYKNAASAFFSATFTREDDCPAQNIIVGDPSDLSDTSESPTDAQNFRKKQKKSKKSSRSHCCPSDPDFSNFRWVAVRWVITVRWVTAQNFRYFCFVFSNWAILSRKKQKNRKKFRPYWWPTWPRLRNFRTKIFLDG